MVREPNNLICCYTSFCLLRLTPDGLTLVYFENDLRTNRGGNLYDYVLVPGKSPTHETYLNADHRFLNLTLLTSFRLYNFLRPLVVPAETYLHHFS